VGFADLPVDPDGVVRRGLLYLWDGDELILSISMQTGPAVVGRVGAPGSLKFTSVGDTVNTAARLEAFDKQHFMDESHDVASRVLVSEEAWRRTRGEFEVQELGAHSLKGKRAPLKIYRVIGPDADRGQGARVQREAVD
jgi:class 3 adenylate cyclase